MLDTSVPTRQEILFYVTWDSSPQQALMTAQNVLATKFQTHWGTRVIIVLQDMHVLTPREQSFINSPNMRPLLWCINDGGFISELSPLIALMGIILYSEMLHALDVLLDLTALVPQSLDVPAVSYPFLAVCHTQYMVPDSVYRIFFMFIADTYSLAGWTECLSCPEGYKCASNDVAPVLCNPGEYSAEGGLSDWLTQIFSETWAYSCDCFKKQVSIILPRYCRLWCSVVLLNYSSVFSKVFCRGSHWCCALRVSIISSSLHMHYLHCWELLSPGGWLGDPLPQLPHLLRWGFCLCGMSCWQRVPRCRCCQYCFLRCWNLFPGVAGRLYSMSNRCVRPPPSRSLTMVWHLN